MPTACLRPSLLALAALASRCEAVEPSPRAIQVHQVGILPGAAKWAAVPALSTDMFTVPDDASGREVISGKLGQPALWVPGDAQVRLADFSLPTQPGTYRVHVDGLADSPRFVVASPCSSCGNGANQASSNGGRDAASTKAKYGAYRWSHAA